MTHFYLLLLTTLTFTSFSQTNSGWYSIIGSAYVDNKSYSLLQHLCDEAGGRLVGSPMNEKALGIMKEELIKLEFDVRLERFKIPGWVRGDDEVMMTIPINRKLRAVALGYVDKTPFIDASLVFANRGYEEDYKNIDAKNKIVLVTSEQAAGKQEILRYEAIDIAAHHGAKAILFIKDQAGATTLAGVSNFQGHPSAIPAYSLTYEEGKWLQRLCENLIPTTLRITTKSYCKETETANIVLTLPGEVKDKIVVGAHFDSWDVGQGGIDNGMGTAILFDVARLIKTYSQKNYYTVEFVWFNGEELGLWGSKRYLEMHSQDNIAAMINMDMTGSPTGFNAMGTDTFIPFFKELAIKLNGFNLSQDIGNSPWTNSDHQPFMIRGIPTITPQAHLENEMVKHYHDLGDTFDKVNKKYLSESAAVISILTKELSNNRDLKFTRRTEQETIEFLKKHKLDERLKKQKEWIFK